MKHVLMFIVPLLLVICSPKCENGVCLENNTCSCSDGYQGNRCSEPSMLNVITDSKTKHCVLEDKL